MRKEIWISLLSLMSSSLIIGQNYWQQKIEYQMDIKMDVANHRFHGNSKIEYVNNSPDTLDKVYFHLYFNAFQPGSMMDVRSRTIEDPDYRVQDRISKLKPDEIGYQKVNAITQKGTQLKFQTEETILVVQLNEPLLPGKKTTFDLDFDAQVPIQIRRSGRNNEEGVDYSMTQWYPKMCEYDRDGWHTNPYIGREFHGVWGDFDVKITIPKNYVIGATGYLQNPQEIGYGYENVNKPLKVIPGENNIWHFKAPNVHDFAWAADPEFTHTQTTINNGTVLHFLYKTDTLAENWEQLVPYAVKCFEFMNENFGVYPYKQYSIIQGGDGGMEYPMCTLITAHGSFAGLVSVMAHESIHSWFQGLLATNEAKHEWMDEGFCTYAQYKTLDHLYERNSINPVIRQYAGYTRLATSGKAEPLTTHADFYKLNGVYGTNAYSKGAVLLAQLGYIMGEDALSAGLKRYFNEWKFKHPTPQDFKRIMEKVSGLELDWYFEQFVETVNVIDYGISKVESFGKDTKITLQRIGDMPMPIDIVITDKDGNTRWIYIPLVIMRGEKGKDMYGITRENKPDWPWVYPQYEFSIDIDINKIDRIEIDPSTRMADVNRNDNVWPVKADLGAVKLVVD